MALETGVAGAYKILPRSNGLIKGHTMYPTSLLCSILRRISEQSTLSSTRSQRKMKSRPLLNRSLPWSMESIRRCWTESLVFDFSGCFFGGPLVTGSSGSETSRCGLLDFSTSPQKILVIFVSWSWSSIERLCLDGELPGDETLTGRCVTLLIQTFDMFQ